MICQATRKKKLDCSAAEFLTIDEGQCVQIMHIGPYDDEPATVALMDEFVKANGYENDFSETHRHYETFLTDAARQQKRIRHPIKKAQ